MSRKLFAKLGEAPEAVRLEGPRGLARGKVEAKGGDYGAGLIAGVSLVTRGEALGHGAWIDSTFIEQVAAAGAGQPEGFKARFAHPGLSSDGIGSVLGRWKNLRKSGSKQVLADLHLLKAAHETPDGNLADYVMRLAAEDPKLFAASIVFWRDENAEAAFAAEHTDKEGRFISPDKENRANLPHWRVRKFEGADLVDEPAANPGGLFSAGRGNALPAEADALLLYALGLSEEAPEGKLLGVHPERARGYVRGFLDRHNISLQRGLSVEEGVVTRTEFEQLRGELESLSGRLAQLRQFVLAQGNTK